MDPEHEQMLRKYQQVESEIIHMTKQIQESSVMTDKDVSAYNELLVEQTRLCIELEKYLQERYQQEQEEYEALANHHPSESSLDPGDND